MNKNESIYLDIIRFSAAMVVFLGHASGQLTGGFLWQISPYLGTAVMIFFVLSGYVIAFVVDTKEKTLHDYTISRLARLSSVVFPALILTFLFDWIGIQENHALYYEGPWPAPEIELSNYLLRALLLQNVWGLNMNPGINVPFWSLSYEMLFYIIFGFIFFLRGKNRILFVIISLIVAGPDIIVYFPIWYAGVIIFRVQKKYYKWLRKNHLISNILCITPLILIICFTPFIVKNFEYRPEFMITSKNILASYICASLFCVHLLFIPAFVKSISGLLSIIAKPIILLASTTFTIYLIHRPLIQLIAAFFENNSSFESRIAVIGGSFIIMFVIGLIIERQKHSIKNTLKMFSSKFFTSDLDKKRCVE